MSPPDGARFQPLPPSPPPYSQEIDNYRFLLLVIDVTVGLKNGSHGHANQLQILARLRLNLNSNSVHDVAPK